MSTAPTPFTTILAPAEWRDRALVHRERVQRWTQPHRRRQARHEPHPVYDFLFQYYSYSGGRLETWHPAPHEALQDTPEAHKRFRGPVYRATEGVIVRDPEAMPPTRRARLNEALQILTSTRGCFELAAELRVLDMQASPYDLRALGFEPVRVETPEGRDEYQRRQRALSERAGVLRDRLIEVVEPLCPGTGTPGRSERRSPCGQPRFGRP